MQTFAPRCIYVRALHSLHMCDWVTTFFSECVFALRGYTSPTRNTTADMNEVMNQLTTRHLTLELQDRRCIAEARRNQVGNRALFRSKMLEHRRIQAQMAQIQRYRESALAHMDAVSNHAINQTFMRAIKGTAVGLDVDDAAAAAKEMQDSIANVNEITELLGQPVLDDVTDEDLESEFQEFSALAEADPVVAPPLPAPPIIAAHNTLPAIELRTAVFERRC